MGAPKRGVTRGKLGGRGRSKSLLIEDRENSIPRVFVPGNRGTVFLGSIKGGQDGKSLTGGRPRCTTERKGDLWQEEKTGLI